MLELLRQQAIQLTPLAKFALGMVLIFGIPQLSSRIRLPVEVGLLLGGVVIGPHVLGLFGEQRPIADFLAELGQLLLMFIAGLKMDLTHLRKLRARSILFGLLTAGIPLLLGTSVGILFGYPVITAIVIGSLFASHTLLGSPIVARLGVDRLEPVIVTIGATVLADTLALLVFAICVSTFERGFSVVAFAAQIVEVIVFVPLVLIGMSRGGAYLLKKADADENAYFVLMFGIMAVAGVLAGIVHLPGIVGTFLAGLALNEAVHDVPAKEKLEFFGNSFFVPIFFMATGFLIEPAVFVQSIVGNFAFVVTILTALVAGKFAAAQIVGRTYHYSSAARKTMWSLTLPQVSATLAAAMVAYKTFDALHQRLIDERTLNVVFVLMVTTAIVGPILTQHIARGMSGTAIDERRSAVEE